ncbi:MAG TPA: hypothetical protein VGF97_03300 [Rhizomicrobium sp.]|jgi:hypothetical protein
MALELTIGDQAAVDTYLVALLTAVKNGGFHVEEARAELAAAIDQAARDDAMFKARIRTNPVEVA